ncbi:MAG: TetR/AcrR family transcriptional regulator [Ancalomicrobiaceae bacterium]|nr:TetR/AcrR family transcriptional regulator [Ancalomicrobiaceae bacterium]
MTRSETDKTDSKGSRELWLSAAFDAFVESGVDSVSIVHIGRRVGLSRTSFYWFFQDREALLAELVELWRTKNTGNLISRVEAYSESIVEAMLNLFDCWLDARLFDSRLEFAMRSWALQSTDIAAKIASADQARIEAMTKMFLRYGCGSVEADVRARSSYLVQIGYISMKIDEALPVRMARIAHYVEIFTGRVPSQHELNRFFSRHNYTPAELGQTDA